MKYMYFLFLLTLCSLRLTHFIPFLCKVRICLLCWHRGLDHCSPVPEPVYLCLGRGWRDREALGTLTRVIYSPCDDPGGCQRTAALPQCIAGYFFKTICLGVASWLSGLRTWRRHCCSSGSPVAQIQSLAWELPHALGAVNKTKCSN